MSGNNENLTINQDPLLTKNAIRKAIWQAIKTKTNYNLSDDANLNKTGGVFTDSIWLRTNYTANPSVQNVIGKLINETNTTNYVSGELYNLVCSSKTSDTITIENISTEQLQHLGISNGTILNRLPMADAKSVLRKLIYEDAKLLSHYNNTLENEIIDDIMIQKLLLSAYDIITDGTTTSSIYKYDDNSAMNYTISGNTFDISVAGSKTYTYYPERLIVKTISQSQRYTVDENAEKITKIGNTVLTEEIPIDFDFNPEYTFKILTKV